MSEPQIDGDRLKQIVEAALMAADGPLSVAQITKLFAHGELDTEEGKAQIRDTLKALEADAEGRGYELKRVASGYRYQVRQELSEWVSRLWEEKPPRYTRALLETLALIAYRQPVTRGDIEQVRGVSVSQNIMRTLQERGWIRVVGQREVPGKPSLYGTTREFLDYFNLKSLDQLPPLTEIRSMIEPLVIEEVAEEAREVAERDHPELMQQMAEDPSAEDDSASSGDAADASDQQSDEHTEPPTDAATEETQVTDDQAGPDEGEDDDPQGSQQTSSAEVVRLPTAPRRG